MKFEEMVDRVWSVAQAERAELSKAAVYAVLKAHGIVAEDTLKAEGEVPMPGIGKIQVRRTGPRIGRNLHTGAPIKIPEQRRAAIVQSGSFKRAMNPPAPSVPRAG
jgi:nucleoid DNA-binding protein